MTDIENPGKVVGYTAQPDTKVVLVNEFKADEERLLRKLDKLDAECVGRPIKGVPSGSMDQGIFVLTGYKQVDAQYDPYWLAAARKHFLEGFMALNRAVFQPQRIKLPEDDE